MKKIIKLKPVQSEDERIRIQQLKKQIEEKKLLDKILKKND